MHLKRHWNTTTAILLAMVFGLRMQSFWLALHRPLGFDDAYMFARYAAHMRQGLGMAWNLDGVPTYGPTSLPWVVVVWLLSFLPLSGRAGLMFGSWVCGLGAMTATAWAVAANARTTMLQSTWRALPFVAVPLMLTHVFGGNAFSGMETMFAAMLSAVFLGMALLWSRGAVRSEWLGAAGVLSFLARPESGIAVVLLPVLVFLLKPAGAVGKRRLAVLLGVIVMGVGFDLLGCKVYFHTALPLSFYMKGHQAYAGYGGVWHPELLMVDFLAACSVYVAAMILFARRSEWRLIACCILPVLSIFAYMQTVTQIMGAYSRYYMPYLAYFVVPAVLLVER